MDSFCKATLHKAWFRTMAMIVRPVAMLPPWKVLELRTLFVHKPAARCTSGVLSSIVACLFIDNLLLRIIILAHLVQVAAGYVLHVGTVTEGALRVGDTIKADVDHIRRKRIVPNHTFTHVLNFALREVLPFAVHINCW